MTISAYVKPNLSYAFKNYFIYSAHKNRTPQTSAAWPIKLHYPCAVIRAAKQEMTKVEDRQQNTMRVIGRSCSPCAFQQDCP